MHANTGIGKEGVAMAIAVAFAMSLINYLLHPVEIVPVEYGVCLDSPDYWQIPPLISWIINTVLIGIITLSIYLINRHFNFVRTTEPALPIIFLIMSCSSAWFTQNLNTSTLLCLVNVVSLGIVFGAYESNNATRQMFIMGGVLGIGSMFQYAFLPMACVYVLWAICVKVLRIKEVLAFLIGILCPYWITGGLGWVKLCDFHFPSFVTLFTTTKDHSDIFFLLLGIGIATILGVLTGLSNSMKLYAGNSQVNAMNLCITIMGLASIICILVDYENIPAYVLTLYLAVATQLANLCALWHIRNEWTVTIIPVLIYIALFVCNLVL